MSNGKRWLVFWLAVLGMGAMPHLVSRDVLRLLLLEGGLVESLAVVMWLVATVAAVWRREPRDRLMVAYAIVFLVLALRESDLLTAIPGGGKQALKLSFYLGESGASIPLRAALAIALGLTAWALLVSVAGTLASMRGRGKLDRLTVRRLIVAGAILVTSQLFEAVQSWVSGWGALAHPLARSAWSIEECLEAIAPALIAITLFQRPRS